MNIRHLIFAVSAVAAAGSVFAEDIGAYVDFSHVISTKTRAEVIAELKQAQAEGLMAFREDTYPVLQQQAGTARSRDEVRSEAIESARNRTSYERDIYFGG